MWKTLWEAGFCSVGAAVKACVIPHYSHTETLWLHLHTCMNKDTQTQLPLSEAADIKNEDSGCSFTGVTIFLSPQHFLTGTPRLTKNLFLTVLTHHFLMYIFHNGSFFFRTLTGRIKVLKEQNFMFWRDFRKLKIQVCLRISELPMERGLVVPMCSSSEMFKDLLCNVREAERDCSSKQWWATKAKVYLLGLKWCSF